jgi:hypothetical protein
MKRQFGDFVATELYCPNCRCAQPVREKLLLVLPTGDMYEYLCKGCGASLGQKLVSGRASAPFGQGSMPSRFPRRRTG